MPELADRIIECVRQFAPDGDGAYVIRTRPDGTMRIEISSPDGDTLSGNGPTLADAITALENKLT